MDIPKKFCHNCGTQLPPGSKFCSSCGTSLASIDERPPQAAAARPAGRVQSQITFEPTVVGGRRNRNDDDEDTIRADRVDSLAELGIQMNGLEVNIDAPGVQRESFANVVKGGLGFPQGYQEAPRQGNSGVGMDAVKMILGEGSAIRPGSSTEIK